MTMISLHRLLTAPLMLYSFSTYAATLYECRAYDGSNFLSNNYCSQSKGVSVRNWTVPDRMTFDQQVENVEAEKSQERARLHAEIASKNQSQAHARMASQTKANQCEWIDATIATKDSELRQPHSAQLGDYLTEERKKLMDQRFALGC